jgi:hypothetical protein
MPMQAGVSATRRRRAGADRHPVLPGRDGSWFLTFVRMTASIKITAVMPVQIGVHYSAPSCR